MKQAKLLADHQPAISFFGKMMLLAVVIVGGFLVIGGKMSLGDLGAFSEYANNVIWPMEILGWLSNGYRVCICFLEENPESGKERAADQRRGGCEGAPTDRRKDHIRSRQPDARRAGDLA